MGSSNENENWQLEKEKPSIYVKHLTSEYSFYLLFLLHTKNYHLVQSHDSIYGTLANMRGQRRFTSQWHLWLWKYFGIYTVMWVSMHACTLTPTTFKSNCLPRICYYCCFLFCWGFDFYFWLIFVWVLHWAPFGGTCIYSSSHQRQKIYSTVCMCLCVCMCVKCQ